MYNVGIFDTVNVSNAARRAGGGSEYMPRGHHGHRASYHARYDPNYQSQLLAQRKAEHDAINVFKTVWFYVYLAVTLAFVGALIAMLVAASRASDGNAMIGYYVLAAFIGLGALIMLISFGIAIKKKDGDAASDGADAAVTAALIPLKIIWFIIKWFFIIAWNVLLYGGSILLLIITIGKFRGKFD
jgi:hypothetical protein